MQQRSKGEERTSTGQLLKLFFPPLNDRILWQTTTMLKLQIFRAYSAYWHRRRIYESNSINLLQIFADLVENTSFFGLRRSYTNIVRIASLSLPNYVDFSYTFIYASKNPLLRTIPYPINCSAKYYHLKTNNAKRIRKFETLWHRPYKNA